MSSASQRRVIIADDAVLFREGIARRYNRLWPLIAEATQHCHRAVFRNNAADDGPFEVGSSRFGIPDHPGRWPDWTPRVLLEL